jgi:hypothetical protein
MAREQREVQAMRLSRLTSNPDNLRSMIEATLAYLVDKVAETIGITRDHAEEVVRRHVPKDQVDDWIDKILAKQTEVILQDMREEDLFEALKFFESDTGKAYLQTGGKLAVFMNDIGQELIAHIQNSLGRGG